MIRQDARRRLDLMAAIKALENELNQPAAQSAYARHINTIPGFGLVCSAELAGEIGTLERFRTEKQFRVLFGDGAFGQPVRRLPGFETTPAREYPGPQSQAMTAVCRHMARVPESRAYYDRKRSEGKTHNQAVRALGRHLARVIWSMLRQDRDYIEPNRVQAKQAAWQRTRGLFIQQRVKGSERLQPKDYNLTE